jgi:dTDP-4-dehydrorhamnose reductase
VTVVVLGATGMLGHVVTLRLREEGRRVVAQGRTPVGLPAVDEGLVLLDVSDRPALEALLERSAPCVVVNCVAAKPGSPASALAALNTRLPHWLADTLESRRWGRLVQIGTDGVFPLSLEDASEDSVADPPDGYGESKLAGEVTREPHLTVRTSIIGPEPRGRSGLLEWFRGGEAPVDGFAGVSWNGVTTLEAARFLSVCLDQEVTGLVHLAGETVTKCELLARIRRVYRVARSLRPVDEPRSVRTLSSRRGFAGFRVRALDTQLEELRSWEARTAARAAA